jgi:hypothetical protein
VEDKMAMYLGDKVHVEVGLRLYADAMGYLISKQAAGSGKRVLQDTFYGLICITVEGDLGYASLPRHRT